MRADLSLSLVMPTYDEPGRLLAALRSLARQDYPAEQVEIIVVDDASPSLDEEALHQALTPFVLTLIRHRTNQGRARARNAGLQRARGDIVVFLDSDMTVEADFLRQHARAHERGSPREVVIGHIAFGPQILPTALTRYLESRGVHRLRGGEIPFKCFVTGNSSLRRALLREVGFFDEEFRYYGGEDLELGYRLHRAGARFRYLPAAVSHHNHLRPLEQLCLLMQTYGRHSIPLLLRKHPELEGVLRLDFRRRRALSPRRLFLAMALRPQLYRPLYWLARQAVEGWLPDLLFDYILWYNRTRGYLDSPSSPC